MRNSSIRTYRSSPVKRRGGQSLTQMTANAASEQASATTGPSTNSHTITQPTRSSSSDRQCAAGTEMAVPTAPGGVHDPRKHCQEDRRPGERGHPVAEGSGDKPDHPHQAKQTGQGTERCGEVLVDHAFSSDRQAELVEPEVTLVCSVAGMPQRHQSLSADLPAPSVGMRGRLSVASRPCARTAAPHWGLWTGE